MCKCTEPIYYNNCTCTVSAVDEVVADVYLTTTELNTLKSQIELAYANRQSFFNNSRYGIVRKDDAYRKDLFLIIIFLYYWNQHSDGTDTGLNNYVTRAEFSKVISKARRIVGSTHIK